MLNVLIVDDSLAIRIKMKSFLEKLGHNIIAEAKNGEEAINLYESLSPDLITMDISMPGMNGIESLEKIMEISNNEANVIMITANGQDGIVKDSLLLGAKGYILKPVTEDKLQDSIGRIFPKYLTSVSDVLDDNDMDDIFN